MVSEESKKMLKNVLVCGAVCVSVVVKRKKKTHLLIEDGLAKGFPSFRTASIDSVRMFHVAT